MIELARTLKVKPAADIAKKWGEVTPGKAGYYEAEATIAGDQWLKNTVGAEKTYKSAVAAAGIEKRFSGGAKKAGADKYQRKVKAVGVDRYGPGVAAAIEDMQTGFEPYQGILDGLAIPDRGPRGSPGNYAIVQKVGDPLHKKRLALLGATAGAG